VVSLTDTQRLGPFACTTALETNSVTSNAAVAVASSPQLRERNHMRTACRAEPGAARPWPAASSLGLFAMSECATDSRECWSRPRPAARSAGRLLLGWYRTEPRKTPTIHGCSLHTTRQGADHRRRRRRRRGVSRRGGPATHSGGAARVAVEANSSRCSAAATAYIARALRRGCPPYAYPLLVALHVLRTRFG
jgi:hypothetical protein